MRKAPGRTGRGLHLSVHDMRLAPSFYAESVHNLDTNFIHIPPNLTKPDAFDLSEVIICIFCSASPPFPESAYFTGFPLFSCYSSIPLPINIASPKLKKR